LIRALGDRGDTSAAPRLLELARSQDDSMRSSSLQALALLAGPAQLPDLVQLVVQATTPTTPVPKRPTRSVQPANASSPAAAIATWRLWSRRCEPGRWKRGWPCCRSAPDWPRRPCAKLLRAALADSEPRVREAALRALCDTRDGELLPDLLKAASGAGDRRCGCWPFAAASGWPRKRKASNFPMTKSWPPSKQYLTRPLEAPEKRLVLSGLGAIPTPRPWTWPKSHARRSRRQSRGGAVGHSNRRVPRGHPAEEAGAALKKGLAVITDPATKAAAQEARKKSGKPPAT
jgi:hypothetical protein